MDQEEIDAKEAARAERRELLREANERKQAEKRRIRESGVTARSTWEAHDVNVFQRKALYTARATGNPGLSTEKQIALLIRFGVDPSQTPEQWPRSKATDLIGKCIARREQGLCNYRQARMLRRIGKDPTKIGYEEARRILMIG